jgi:hypothetical protein
MSQFHVDQIETHLKTLYEAQNWVPALDDVTNMSRLLALHAVKLSLAQDDTTQSIVEITDGTEDHGIDAVGIEPVGKLVVFVQSKWRQDGTGSMSLADVLKFLAGIRSLLGMKADDEPVHASANTKAAVRNLLKTPGARIRLATVTTAADPLSEAVEAPILELLDQLNDLEGIEPLASHAHLGQSHLFSSIASQVPTAVDIEFQMSDWGRASEPQKMYYGRVSAVEVAGWFKQHGADLFAENIRVVIPRSDINDGILSTIQDEPNRFLYYNNGVTILAESIEIGPGGALNREVGYFKLSGASVVNGAQTVSTLGAALGTEYEPNLGNAFVLMRCIEVPKSEDDLASRITRFANTQNEVSSQDFAFLDREQHRLATELRVLGFEYILRSAEVPKSQDLSAVIDVRSAAIALACASPSISYAVIAKREVSRLFADTSVYSALFNAQTDPLRLSRAVQITNSVDELLDEVEEEADGLRAGVAIHGRRVVAHLVMRELGDTFLGASDTDVASHLSALPATVETHLKGLIDVFPPNAYPGNVFKNQARVIQLLKDAGSPTSSPAGTDEAAPPTLF